MSWALPPIPRAVVARRAGELLTVRFHDLGRVEGMDARSAAEAEAGLDRLAAQMDAAEAAAISPLPSAVPAPVPTPAAEAPRPWWAFWRYRDRGVQSISGERWCSVHSAPSTPITSASVMPGNTGSLAGDVRFLRGIGRR